MNKKAIVIWVIILLVIFILSYTFKDNLINTFCSIADSKENNGICDCRNYYAKCNLPNKTSSESQICQFSDFGCKKWELR